MLATFCVPVIAETKLTAFMELEGRFTDIQP